MPKSTSSVPASLQRRCCCRRRHRHRPRAYTQIFNVVSALLCSFFDVMRSGGDGKLGGFAATLCSYATVSRYFTSLAATLRLALKREGKFLPQEKHKKGMRSASHHEGLCWLSRDRSLCLLRCDPQTFTRSLTRDDMAPCGGVQIFQVAHDVCWGTMAAASNIMCAVC